MKILPLTNAYFFILIATSSELHKKTQNIAGKFTNIYISYISRETFPDILYFETRFRLFINISNIKVLLCASPYDVRTIEYADVNIASKSN